MCTPRDPLEAPLESRARAGSATARGVADEVGEGSVSGISSGGDGGGKKRHLLFIGDSLFCGIGQEEMELGPALPRAIASGIAEVTVIIIITVIAIVTLTLYCYGRN